jgi:peptide/nickel transport system substrate-binding protein
MIKILRRQMIAAIVSSTLTLPILGFAAQPSSAMDRLVVGLTGSPTTFHPWDLADPNKAQIAQFYNVLVHLDKQLKPVPELAKSWEFEDGNRTLVLHLEHNVKFNSGRLMTAQDVRRSWQRVLGKFTDSNANLAPLAAQVKDMEVVDDHTIKIKYEEPSPTVFDFLDLFYIVDMDNFDKIGSEPIGTGPFKMASYQPQNRMVLVPNEDYWRKPPTVEVELRVIPDPQALLLNLRSGTVDAVAVVPNREVSNLERAGFVVEAADPDGAVLDVLFNVQNEKLKDKRVRQAINMAINRDRVHRLIYQGKGELRCLPFPTYSIAYDGKRADSCRYDVESAKKLLAEAGYPNGFDIEIVTSRQLAESWSKFAELFQSDLAQIGIRASVRDMDVAGYMTQYWSRAGEILIHSYGRANKDPGSVFGSAIVWKVGKGENVQNFYNPELESLVKQSVSTLDQGQRKDLYGRISDMLLDDPYTLSIHTNPVWFAHTAGVVGLQYTKDGFPIFENAKKK